MFLFEHSPFEASRMKIVFPSLHPLIDIYTPNSLFKSLRLSIPLAPLFGFQVILA
jgi:hypothetical protein